MPTQILKLDGLTCEACAKLSALILKRLPGVGKAEVKPDGTAAIDAERVIPAQEIEAALANTPYRLVNPNEKYE